jgi:hypothetical protein
MTSATEPRFLDEDNESSRSAHAVAAKSRVVEAEREERAKESRHAL